MKFIMFADDTNIFFVHNDLKTLFTTANNELENINEWFKANKLYLNVKKTNYILFYSRRKTDNLPLKLPQMHINNNEIKRVTSTKFLGVIIDENLTFKEHLKTVENKVSKNLGMLYKAKPILDKKSLKALYFSFKNSYVNYANIVWGSTYRTSL